jgi:hypothetical protein
MFTQALQSQLQLSVPNHLGIAVTTFIVSVAVLTANFTCSRAGTDYTSFSHHSDAQRQSTT